MGQRCWRKKTESLRTISTSTREETSDTPTMTQGRSTEEITTTFQSTSVSPLPTQYDQTTATQVPGNLVTKILITDAQKKIYLADLSTFTFQVHISLEGEPWDIDFDETGQKIYWTDISDNGLWCADIDGSNAVRIRTSTYDGPKGLAISQTSRQAFCAYEGSHVVTATDLNSPGSEMVIINPTGDNPRAIVVDDEQNVIYWTRTKGIDKAGKDGSGKSEVYNNEDLSDIDGLSVDVSGQRLLFSDSGSKKVFILNLNTNSVTELTSSYEPSDIAFFNQKLYLLNINPTAIYEVNNLDTSPTFVQHATSAYTAPRRMHIQTVIVSNLEGESEEEEEEVDD
ncbi:low-density lipoprotein receptor-related protein 4-like [Lytechinus variegatus]|uniref:low-density lipoprotein receptor-related protein 4-like n=1 Tax=Lytechinus variegatus TaxID=7654 RepID=UPI001BB290EA|nr:low-density lipoprotein receptor-related protein 4-like [Lytechinus variegatus]